MEIPAISIVIPCYNQLQFLTECLRSVLAQTFEDWEVIVVDDASSDGDVQGVVNSFYDRRIQLVRHEQNRGLAAARNTGVRHALAQIIVPLDADDKLSPTFLEVVLDNLSNQSVSFVYFDIQCFGDSSTIWHSKPFDPAAVAREHQFILGTAPFRKEVWTQSGGWCEEPVFKLGYEDTDFLLSAVRYGHRGVYVAQPLYLYRRSNSSMSARPRIYVLPIYKRLYERNKSLIVRYSSYSEWMARGWLEVAGGYLKLGKPLLSLGCGLTAWMTSKYIRAQAVGTIKSSIQMLRNRATRVIKSNLEPVIKTKVKR